MSYDSADFFRKAVNMARTERAMAEWHRIAAPLLKRDPTDATIGMGNFTQGIPAFWFARSLDPLMLETLYTPFKDSAWVRRAIKYVSGPISAVNLVFTNVNSDAAMRRHRGRGRRLFTARGIVRRDDENEIELPQVRQFLREPMRGLTYEDFVEASIGWMKMQECFWLIGDKVRLPFPEASNRSFEPIIVARPDRMRAILEDRKIVAWDFVDYSGKAWTLDPQQVVRLFGWNPYDPHRGLGDYPSASVAAESHWLAGKFKRSLTADNDTAPIISAKNGTPTDTQIDQIKMQLMERRGAKQRGMAKTLFLPGEIDVHDPKILSVDAAFITGMLEDRHEIFIAFGVPPGLADVKASYSIGQASDWFALIFNTCIPEGNKFCAAMEVLIQRLTGQRIEVGLDWDEHYVMQQVRSERMKDADSLFAKGVPMREISEYLNLGLPEFDNDDIGYIAINLTPTQSQQEMEASAPAEQDYSENPQTPEPGTETQSEPVKEMLRVLKSGSLEQRTKNEALWRAHMRLRSKTVKVFQSKCSKLFNEYRASALRKLEAARRESIAAAAAPATRSLVDVIFDAKQFGAELYKQLEGAMRAALQTAGDELNDEIGKPDDPWTMPPGQVRTFIAGRENNLKDVGDTAFEQLKTALTEGLDKGETTDQLTDRVRGVFNNLQKFEAKRIAMTETSAAYGFARHQAMSDAGIEYKSWLSSHGPHVRPAHAAAEMDYGAPADAIPIDDPFEVGGEDLMYPGDPSGSPENIINCQCIQLARIAPEEGPDEN